MDKRMDHEFILMNVSGPGNGKEPGEGCKDQSGEISMLLEKYRERREYLRYRNLLLERGLV